MVTPLFTLHIFQMIREDSLCFRNQMFVKFLLILSFLVSAAASFCDSAGSF